MQGGRRANAPGTHFRILATLPARRSHPAHRPRTGLRRTDLSPTQGDLLIVFKKT